MNELMTIDAVAWLIREGHTLAVAGAETALDQLPAGAWIGGTIPYFMGPECGVKTDERVFVTELPGDATSLRHYGVEQLADIVGNAPANGYTLAILPAGSPSHGRYAAECRDYPDAFLKPTVGWIAGVDLDRLSAQRPRIYLGTTGRKYADGAVVAHVSLPAHQLASIEIVNIFEPDGVDVLRFPHGGFGATECLVNGRPRTLAPYLAERGVADGRLPLVGDFAGAHVNVSFQSVDVETGLVSFYAPVFADVDYCIARPVVDQVGMLRERMAPEGERPVAFSCNCILNYLYGELQGKSTGALHGPITFGEIGHQLLNQTFAALRID